jgi:hypothetical protein
MTSVSAIGKNLITLFISYPIPPVRQITTQLSEAVVQLTLMVLRNKEINAEIPTTLPNGVNAVIRACGVLLVTIFQIIFEHFESRISRGKLHRPNTKTIQRSRRRWKRLHPH